MNSIMNKQLHFHIEYCTFDIFKVYMENLLNIYNLFTKIIYFSTYNFSKCIF